MNIAWQDDDTNDVQYWKQRAIDEYQRCNRLIHKAQEADRLVRELEEAKTENAGLRDRLSKTGKTARDAYALLKEFQEENIEQKRKIKKLTLASRKLRKPAETNQRRETVATVPLFLL